MHPRNLSIALVIGSIASACSADSNSSRTFTPPPEDANAALDAQDAAVARDAPPLPEASWVPQDVAPIVRDAQPSDTNINPDAACAASSATATVERLPVDIIWMVDNSVSMAPAIDQVITGLNRFASLVGSRGLDYRVVMLSLRSPERQVTVMGSNRYAVCIPRPLAGDDRCGNGERFLHSSVDIRSTQPLEQLLGTLGQTRGYTAIDPRGGEAWRHFLRPNATKTLVVVTDDQSRLSAQDFETFRGGTNPNSSQFSLPPGLNDPSWEGLFRGYTFNGIYGWGSETDPGARCSYPNGTTPPASGSVYTALVNSTRGVRAQLCAGASAWTPFFNNIATAVERTARMACDVSIPAPPDGSVIDSGRINVVITGTSRTLVGKVQNLASCGATGGWYYDNDARPTRVYLCPASCERAQTELRSGSASLQVQFGCLTIPG